MPKMKIEKSILTKITLLLMLGTCLHGFIYAQEDISMADKIIAITFKSLAKAYTATVDIDRLKEDGIDKIKKMNDEKFQRRYSQVYAALKDVPLFLKVKYGITKDMTKEQAIRSIKSADKKKIYEIIDSIPDKTICGQFKEYLNKNKQEIQRSNIIGQVNKIWNKMMEKIQR